MQDPALSALSLQEMEVLIFFAKGVPLQEIAGRLSMQETETQQYLKTIRTKLGLSDQADLKVFCEHRGWLKPQG